MTVLEFCRYCSEYVGPHAFPQDHRVPAGAGTVRRSEAVPARPAVVGHTGQHKTSQPLHRGTTQTETYAYPHHTACSDGHEMHEKF